MESIGHKKYVCGMKKKSTIGRSNEQGNDKTNAVRKKWKRKGKHLKSQFLVA